MTEKQQKKINQPLNRPDKKFINTYEERMRVTCQMNAVFMEYDNLTFR